MNTRALTLAIRLLCAGAIGVALGSTSACLFGCGDTWQESELIDLGVSTDFTAIAVLDNYGGPESKVRYVAVGAEGAVVMWGPDSEAPEGIFVEQTTLGSADLRAIWVEDTNWWIVGDEGMAAISSDAGQTWTTLDLGTSADLHAITSIGSQIIIAGDDFLRVLGASGDWVEPTPPAGGWGELRALDQAMGRMFAVGLEGVILSATDPLDTWTAEGSGTSVDLFDVGSFYHRTNDSVLAVGAGGTVLVLASKGWKQISNSESVDIVTYMPGYLALGADGTLFEINSSGKLSVKDTLAGALAMDGSGYSGVIAVGAGGVAYEKNNYDCVGGRPFLVDGEAHTAGLCRDDAWSGARLEPLGPTPAASPERDPGLAAAWAQDALYEHASIASFARFALELLALGAPPRLLRELSAASHDELRHAQACFALARRFGGVALSPGPMPLPPSALARVGDPLATALALFEEGCLNESVAACEAAEAAAASEDPEVRRVLEGIAADERRHAVAGWDALRWLLDTYGPTLAAPLRKAIARSCSARPLEDSDAAEAFDPAWVAFGRVPPERRAIVRQRVIDELVRPLAHAMLSPAAGAAVEPKAGQR